MADEMGYARVHLDSAKLRCLAHPLRTRLLGALRVDGPATSARLADRLNTNTGATSYHLRQLADVGLVTEDEDRGTGRERWWQAAHEVSTWTETRFMEDPDDRAAAEWLLGHNLRNKTRWREDWLETRQEWPWEWREAADSSDLRLDLTPPQLRAMNAELLEVIRRFRVAGPEAGGDVQPVMVLLDAFPAPRLNL